MSVFVKAHIYWVFCSVSLVSLDHVRLVGSTKWSNFRRKLGKLTLNELEALEAVLKAAQDWQPHLTTKPEAAPAPKPKLGTDIHDAPKVAAAVARGWAK